MNWKPTDKESPVKENKDNDFEIMSEKIILWARSTDALDKQDGLNGYAIFGTYSFTGKEFMPNENHQQGLIKKGWITITHWDYINEPNPLP